MKRLLVLVFLVLGVAAAPMAHATISPPNHAYVTGWDLTTVNGEFAFVEIYGEVSCTAGETYVGRVFARASGETVFLQRIRGVCTGNHVDWVVGATQRLGTFTCNDPIVIGGQIRLSDGSRFFIDRLSMQSICP